MTSPVSTMNGHQLLLLTEVAEELRLTDKAVRHLNYTGQLGCL